MATAEALLWGCWRQQLRAELRCADPVHGAGSWDGACKNPRGARSWPEGRGQGSEGAEKGLGLGLGAPEAQGGVLGGSPRALSLQTSFSLQPLFFGLTSWGDQDRDGVRGGLEPPSDRPFLLVFPLLSPPDCVLL